MNSRERMRVAMAKGVPDRVPLMCQLSTGHYALQSSCGMLELWFESEAFARALIELQRRYGFDGVLVNLPGRDPHWRAEVREVVAAPGAPGANRVVWRDGSSTVVPADDLPYVLRADGRRWHPAFDEVDPGQLHYVDPHATWGIAYPQPEPGFPPWQCAPLEKAIELGAGEISVHGEVFSPFSQLMELLELSEGMMALVLDEGKCRAILERLGAGALELALLQARAGCDALLISSAFAGAGFISRGHYKRFEQPYLERIVAGIRGEFPDLPVYLHTCGAIGDRLDLMESSGVDGIDTLDPPPIGTVDLSAAIAYLGKRLFIKGNVDPVNTLLKGTTEEVRCAARERLRIAAPGGAYILSSACSVAPYTSPENILALHEIILETGIYA